MTQPVAWLNGRLIPAVEAAVPVTDLGVVAGASITEMIRTFRGDPFRLDEHLDRLFASLEHVDFPTVPSRCDLLDAVEAVAVQNVKLIPREHDLGIVVFVTAGQNPTYLGSAARDRAAQGTVCVHSFPLPFELWAAKYRTGQHLASVDIRPLDAESVPPQAKHRNRLHWFRADKAARSRFPTAVALVATRDGLITETSAGNILLIKDGAIRTPPSELVLGGISRQVTRELAISLGFDWEEARLTYDDVRSADEVLTTSTTYCLLPVTRFDDAPIGRGVPGDVFHRLATAWNGQAGFDIVEQAETTASSTRRNTDEPTGVN